MTGKPKHGLSRTPEYRAWQQMRLRCLDPKHQAYPSYGGRGITVCERWKDSPENFVADMGPRPAGHELDRIDNNKGYEPVNCRWATRSQNDRNRRSNRHLSFNGETLTIAEWSERYGVRSDTITSRIENGWDAGRAITTPARAKAKNGHALPPTKVRLQRVEHKIREAYTVAVAAGGDGISATSLMRRLSSRGILVSRRSARRYLAMLCTRGLCAKRGRATYVATIATGAEVVA